MLNMLIVLLISVLVLLLVFISFKFWLKDVSMSPYECGFSEISNSRKGFSFRFFLIAILFLVFDVEIILMLVIPLVKQDNLLFYNFYIFILVLLLGVVYEIYQGAISWLS